MTRCTAYKITIPLNLPSVFCPANFAKREQKGDTLLNDPKVIKQKENILLNELKRKGIKHNPDDIVKIGKTRTEIVFLENGNRNAGLQHITERHADDFARRGIPQDKIPDLIMETVTKGKIIGTNKGAMLYEVLFNDKKHKKQYVQVTIGSNGFIVQANPIKES